MPPMSFDNRQTRRMLDRMGVSMAEIEDVQEVIIRTSEKELLIKNASVLEMNTKKNATTRIFQVTGEDVEERLVEKPQYSKEDVMLVAQQANVSEAKAEQALKDTNGDLPQAILRLS